MTQKEKDFCEDLAMLMDGYGITMRVITLVDDPYCYCGSFVTFAEENKEEQTSESLFAFDEDCRASAWDYESDACTVFTSADIRKHIEELTKEKGIEAE